MEKYIAVEKLKRPGHDEPYFNARFAEIAPFLVKEGLVKGKQVKGKWSLLANKALQQVLAGGIEPFMHNMQGWSFVAIEAPLAKVAALLAKRPGVRAYHENVTCTRLKDGSPAPDTNCRHLFLVQTPGSSWCVLLQTIHWCQMDDITHAIDLARDFSKRLKTTAIAAFNEDTSGSGLTEFKKGKGTRDITEEGDGPEEFLLYFYRNRISLPSCFITQAADKRSALLQSESPAAFERTDYLQMEYSERHSSA